MNDETASRTAPLLCDPPEEAAGRYPWFVAAQLLLWQRGGTITPALRLRQQFRPLPDFLLKKNETAATRDPFDVIEKFLQETPSRRSPATGTLPGEDLSRESVTEDPDLISEELAEIYAKQGFYSKAREIYTRLSLLYPEKSVYFAEIIAGLDTKKSGK